MSEIVYWECACGEPNSGREDDLLLECRRCGLPYLLPENPEEIEVEPAQLPDGPVAFTPAKDRLTEGVKLYCQDCYGKKFAGTGSVALWPEQVQDAVARRGEPMARCAECGRNFLA